MAGIKEVVGAIDLPSVTTKDKEEVVRATLEAIRGICMSGQSVIIKNYGTFKMKVRKARTCRNPKTGEPVYVAEKTELTFKAA